MSVVDFLADVPVDRVVSLPGVRVDDLARAIAWGQGELAAIVIRPPASCATPGAFAEAAVGDLERAAVELLPAWLPGAGSSRIDVGGLAAARLLAAEHARQTHYPRSFLIDLAVLALTGLRPAGSGLLPLRVRARELARLVAGAFGRRRMVLLVDVTGGRQPRAGHRDSQAGHREAAAADPGAVVAGAEWLVHSGGPAVWLFGAESDRIPAVHLTYPQPASGTTRPQPVGGTTGPEPMGGMTRPESVGGVVLAGETASSAARAGDSDLPAAVGSLASGSVAESGSPHPASAVEAALEAALAVEPWAAGRRWNAHYQTNVLTSPVRLDLFWPLERCVVEIDGPEHCHPRRFDEDRRRDVQLQIDGYAVLRFTNARITHDVGAVVHQIGTFLRDRRRDTSGRTPPWPEMT